MVAVNPVVAGDFEDGVAAVERGDFALALRIFQPLAKQGDAKGQNGLGRIYNNGWGVKRDYLEAARWYRMAAEQQYASAQMNLGLLYAKGHGVSQNYAEAAKLFRRAAEQGEASAQFNLGLAYYGAKGVERNAEKTQYWWQQAAERGHAVAQYNLAAVLWSGDGIAQDQALAMHWFRQAKSNGSDDATNFLLTLFEPMYRELTEDTLEKVRGDSPRTIPLIDEFGLYKLGLQAVDKRQYSQAFGYWEPLAKDGHVESQFSLSHDDHAARP